jgi:hypothetical protein
MHTLNLTRRKEETSPTTAVRRPTQAEINELKSGVERFGSYLHAKATAELEQAIRLQDTACEQYMIAFDLHEQLTRDCHAMLDKDPSFDPLSAEWANRERMPYTLCYMQTRQKDVKGGFPQPIRRTQEQWEDVFLSNKFTQKRATDASWMAAIKDATTEATDAWTNLQEASRLLRECARTETVDRHAMLREVSNKWCTVFTDHIDTQDVFEFQFEKGALFAGLTYDEEVATQGHSPRDDTFQAVIHFTSLLRESIPTVLQRLDTALKAWSHEEMEPRGKKIVSLAKDFDARTQKIELTFSNMREDLKQVRDFLRQQQEQRAAANPSAFPQVDFFVPETPTHTEVDMSSTLLASC